MKSKVQEVIDVLDGKIVPTEEEIKLYRQAVNSTYQAIGSDAQLDESNSFDILEVVLDASYVHSYGGMTEEQYKKFDNWVRQELTGNYKAGMKKLVKILWDYWKEK